MKNIFALFALLTATCTTAMADTANANANAGSASQAGSVLVLDQSSHGSNNGSNLANLVPNVVAPNLATTLTETCMGSTSFGASGSGFGFSFGTTWRDHACVRRLDARQMSAFGDIPTAREMMCESELVREAAKRAGRACVADGGQAWGVPVASAPQEQIVPTAEAAAPVVREQVKE